MPEPAVLIALGALLVSAVNFFLAFSAFRRTHFGLITVEAAHSAGAGTVESAVIFMATDLLLGFKPLAPEVFPAGGLR